MKLVEDHKDTDEVQEAISKALARRRKSMSQGLQIVNPLHEPDCLPNRRFCKAPEV